MNVFAAIEHRREITSFKPDPIPQDVLDRLIESLYLSPSGNNLPSREYIVVTDRDMLQQLTPTTPYMKWLGHAAAGVVIIANQGLSKYWLQDASIAGGYAWLTAVSMGLGAAWGAVYHAEDDEESSRREAYVRERLSIPDAYRVVAILGFGYPAAEPPKKTMYPIEQVLHRERF
jgi:nitroreductase